MQRKKIRWLGLVLCLCLVCFGLVLNGRSQPAIAQAAPLIEPYLVAGRLADGEAAMQAYLAKQPNDDKARFSLGTVQFMSGVERLMQSLYRYGLRKDSFTQFLPILRLPAPTNPKPEVLSYDAARQILQTWLQDLKTAEATLAQVDDPAVKLALRMGMIRLDFNADRTIGNDESLWRIFAATTGAQVTEQQAQSFLIAFDTGDAVWLRGYCNLLSAMAETVLAYDWKEMFERTGHLAFANVQTPHTFLREPGGWFDGGNGFNFADLIGFFHLVNFPVAEPARLTAALQHLQTVTNLSRQSWSLITAETDNDREWLPNPKQKSVIPGAEVNQEMITNWYSFLDETDAILAGKKLLPFWRGRTGRGLNLSRVFTEPRPFDAVLWVQGTAATPYLQTGTMTNARLWNELMRVFGGQFFGFAVWFN